MDICNGARSAATAVLLFGGWYCFPACSNAQGDKLDRGTALAVLRKAGIKNEITVEAHTQLAWDDAMWGGGKYYERVRQRVQPELDFLNHLVDAGIFRRKPDQAIPCRPEPGYTICQDRRNMLYNFEAVPSADVRVFYPGQSMNGRSIEFAVLVLAKAADPKITGVTQEGGNAAAEFDFGYGPTDLYRRVFPLMRDALAKCPAPSAASAFPIPLTNNPAPSYCGHWPSEAEIGGKKDHGSVRFRKYDDGWRIVPTEN
jgi:hypothetical protein